MNSEIAVRLWIFAIMNAGSPGDTQNHEKTTASTAHTMARRANGLTHIKI